MKIVAETVNEVYNPSLVTTLRVVTYSSDARRPHRRGWPRSGRHSVPTRSAKREKMRPTRYNRSLSREDYLWERARMMHQQDVKQFDPESEYAWEEIPVDTPPAILAALGGMEATRVVPGREAVRVVRAGVPLPWPSPGEIVLEDGSRRPSAIRCRTICRWATTTFIRPPAIGKRVSSSRPGGAPSRRRGLGLGRATP